MTVATQARYVMNAETGVIYAYSEALLAMESPKFVEYKGELPPFDLKLGQRVVKSVTAVANRMDEEPSPEERIERICAILPMVPKDEVTESGQPGLRAVEQLSMLKDVKRSEIKAAMKLRLEIVNARDNRVREEAEAAEEATESAVAAGR